MTKKISGPALFIEVGAPRERLADGVAVPARFTARYVVEGLGTVELDIETVEGRARVREVGIEELRDGDGVTGLDLKGTPALELLATAVEMMGLISSGHRRGDRSAVRAAARAASRQHKKQDATRLQEVADAYAADGIKGVIGLGVGDRQARRLKKAAQEAGLIPGSAE